MQFLSPEGGEPKYSTRVVPKPTEVLSKGGTQGRSLPGLDFAELRGLDFAELSGHQMLDILRVVFF